MTFYQGNFAIYLLTNVADKIQTLSQYSSDSSVEFTASGSASHPKNDNFQYWNYRFSRRDANPDPAKSTDESEAGMWC